VLCINVSKASEASIDQPLNCSKGLLRIVCTRYSSRHLPFALFSLCHVFFRSRVTTLNLCLCVSCSCKVLVSWLKEQCVLLHERRTIRNLTMDRTVPLHSRLSVVIKGSRIAAHRRVMHSTVSCCRVLPILLSCISAVFANISSSFDHCSVVDLGWYRVRFFLFVLRLR
jgi:hypothetical protein